MKGHVQQESQPCFGLMVVMHGLLVGNRLIWLPHSLRLSAFVVQWLAGKGFAATPGRRFQPCWERAFHTSCKRESSIVRKDFFICGQWASSYVGEGALAPLAIVRCFHGS